MYSKLPSDLYDPLSGKRDLLFQENQMPGFLISEEKSDLQRAKLEGLFDEISPTPYVKALAYALWGVSYHTLAKTRISKCSSIVTEKAPKITKPKPPVQCEKSSILDAPNLSTNYYDSPFSWGELFHIALGSELYAYNPDTKDIALLVSGAIEESNIHALVNNNRYLLRVGSDPRLRLIDSSIDKIVRDISCKISYNFSALDGNNSFYVMARRPSNLSLYDFRCSLGYDFKYKARNPVSGICFDSSSNTLAISSSRDIQLFDPRKMDEPKLKFTSHISPGKAFAFLPDGRHVISGGGTEDTAIKIWNAQTGVVRSEIQTGAQICGIKILNNNSFFVHRGFEKKPNPFGKISCLTLKKDQFIKEVSTGNDQEQRVLFSAQNPKDPLKLITGTDNETLSFWAIKNVNLKKVKQPESILEGPILR